MQALIVGDFPPLLIALEEILKNHGYQTKSAVNIYQAKDYWNTNKDSIKCLIVGLNISPDGLNAHEINETKLGLYSGWVWLNNYVFPERPKLKKNTIIFTGYKEKLIDKLSKDNELDLLDGICIISKKNTDIARQFIRQIKTLS
jgi:hypothetical protein